MKKEEETGAVTPSEAQELSEYLRLANENEQLKTALKQARESARHKYQVTTRCFASMCGISPTQLSKWTSTIPSQEPDFKD